MLLGILCSYIIYFWENRLPNNPVEKDHVCQTCEWSALETDLPAHLSLKLSVALTNIQLNFMRNTNSELPNKTAYGFLYWRNYEIIVIVILSH